MSRALYRKYRSRSLDEVLGQDHITAILGQALKKQRLAHAYLLTGPRGTGKTSVARILAHEINQIPYDDDSTHLDIIEIDAASNNGVDDIRNLREKAQITPVFAKYKIYIIDEVHMLSKPAFNALLKTLEEPPEHIIFILATTDADKLPATIISRVQQYYFRPISTPVIANHLINIAKKEGFKLEEAAAKIIAEQSRGGFRDSISLLDQLSNLADKKTPVTARIVAENLGLNNEEKIEGIIAAYDKHDNVKLLSIIHELDELGGDPAIIASQLIGLLRARLVKSPRYIYLLKELIEVSRHPHPDLRLLTALLSTDNYETVQPPLSAPRTSQVKRDDTPTLKPGKKRNSVENVSKKITTGAPKKIDWDELINQTKRLSMGLFSLLSKCDYDYNDGELTLYAGTQFSKKKLDSAKNRSLISQALASQSDSISVIITSEHKPPADEKIAAAVAAIGGGEEIKLEDLS